MKNGVAEEVTVNLAAAKETSLDAAAKAVLSTIWAFLHQEKNKKHHLKAFPNGQHVFAVLHIGFGESLNTRHILFCPEEVAKPLAVATRFSWQ